MSAVEDGGRGVQRSQLRPFGEVKKGYTYFGEGDILFAKITPCMQNGKHAIARDLADGLGFGSTEFHVVRAGSEVIPGWVHRYLLQPWVLQEAAANFSGSAGQQRVPESFLAAIRIPLPPIGEQARITAILREQMAAVERAGAAAKARLEAAKAFPAAYLRAIFTSDDAVRWPRRRLGEIADIVGGIQKTPDRAPVRFHRPYLTVRNVQRGYLDLSHVERFDLLSALRDDDLAPIFG